MPPSQGRAFTHERMSEPEFGLSYKRHYHSSPQTQAAPLVPFRVHRRNFTRS